MRAPRWCLVTVGFLVATILLVGCGDDDGPKSSGTAYRLPDFPASEHFLSTIDHPYLPLHPGARWEYRAKTSDGVERTVVVVLRDKRLVDGVEATVVHDRAYLDGTLSEETYDWFAQDDQGNVWYLGEDTTAYEAGKPPSKEGSWEAGKAGAKAGLAMPGTPVVGDRYQQEYQAGTAEDRGEIVALDAHGSVPWGAFTDAVRTRDTTPLEPDAVEHKYYVRDVGTVLEEEDGDRVELISFSPGAS